MSQNRSVIVTGGASGIGLACVQELAAEGWAVTIADMNGHGQTVADDLIRAGHSAQFIQTDVTNEDQVRSLVEASISRFGQLYGAVNSAGIAGNSKPIHELTLEEWDRVNAINLRGMFLCMKHQIGAMWPHKQGSIVAVSSAAALKGLPWSSDYCASKAGIDGMVRGAAMDCIEQNIRVNALLPGATLTPLATDSTNANPALAKTNTRPMGRLADPREIAAAAVWLLSDKASFTTGISMPVDGGMVIA